MNTTPKFDRSPLGSTKSKMDIPDWNTVMDLYESGKDADVLTAILRYVNPEISTKFGNKEGNYWEIPHGSVIVKIKQTDDEIIVEAPFLDISNSIRLPLMRQVASLNFHPLTLTKIVLDDQDQLKFVYRGPLELCDPYKLYYIFREICINADRYDDEFISKFKAEWLIIPRVEKFSDDELETVWNVVQSYIDQAYQYIEYLENKRLTDYLYDIFKSTFSKIDYYIAPQGFLRSEMENSISDLDGKDPYNERVYRAKEFLNKLKNYDKEKFLENIYKADEFISVKYASTVEDIRKNMSNTHKTALDEIGSRSYMGAFFTMYCGIFRIFYYNNIDDELSELLTSALEKSANKPWEEGAQILKEAFDTMMDESKYVDFINSLQTIN